MKKQVIIGAAALSSSILLMTPLSANAATCQTVKIYSNNNCQISKNLQDINNSNCQLNSNVLNNISNTGNNNIIVSKGICLSDIYNGTVSLQDLTDGVLEGITLPENLCPTPNGTIDTDTILDYLAENGLLQSNNEQPEASIPTTPETNIPDVPAESQPVKENPETGNSDISLPDKEDEVAPTEDSSKTDDTDTSQYSYMKQVVSLVNEQRAKYGLAPLTIDSNMEKAALVRAREIQTSFAHTRPDGSSFSTALKDAGVSYRQSGENIAWGQRTPEEVMNGWMNSSGHRANILNSSYSRIGVGYVQNASGTGYWVQLFAN